MFDLAHFHKIIRNKVIWIIFLILIIASFVFTFTPNAGQGDILPRENPSIGRVSGRKIGLEAYDLASAHTSRSRQGNRPQDETDEEYRKRVLTRIALQEVADEAGIRVTLDELKTMVGSADIFKNEQGQFDPRAFQFWLYQQKWPGEAAFFQFQASEGRVSKLNEFAGGGAMLVSPNDLREAYERDYQSFEVNYAVIERAKALTNEVAVTDAMVEAYYKENPDEFRQGEEARVKFLTVTLNDAFTTNNVTEAEIQAFYTANLTNEFTRTVTSTNAATTNVTLSTVQMSLAEVRTNIIMRLAFPKAQEKMRETAYTIFDQVMPRRGFQHQSFEEIQAAYRLPLGTSDYFTVTQPVPGIEAGPEFIKAVFALGTNLSDRIAEPFVTSNRAYIVQLEDRRPERIRSLDEVRGIARIRAKIKADNDALLALAKARREEIAAALAAGKDFTNAVASVQLVGTNTLTFTRSGGEVRKVPGMFQILNELDNAKPGDLLPPVATSDSAILARLVAVKPADPAGFEERKGMYASALMRRRFEALVRDFHAQAEKRVELEQRAPQS